MRAELARAAGGASHVLLQGESGTGKELAAGVIHHRSSRAKGPFVSRNASAFTSTLIASELFGNPANYPNPGMPARKGLLGTADGGTLFLDEIGDCPLDAQAQLLRVMDQGEYQPVGEAVARRVFACRPCGSDGKTSRCSRATSRSGTPGSRRSPASAPASSTRSCAIRCRSTRASSTRSWKRARATSCGCRRCRPRRLRLAPRRTLRAPRRRPRRAGRTFLPG